MQHNVTHFVRASLVEVVILLWVSGEMEGLQEVFWSTRQQLVKYVEASLSCLLLHHARLQRGGEEEGGRGGRERREKERGRAKQF